MNTEDPDDLARRLPELRSEHGFPNGSDDAILAMSLPPQYTACPNPYLTEWLERTKPPGYDDAEYVDPGPFATDISVGKGNLFYKAHSYPTKVPHPAIMRFLLHYTRPGDVVLDGFCGTGMTGLAAQACGAPDLQTRQEIEAELGDVKWGYRRAVLQDLSPSATLIAAGLNLPVDAPAFERRSAEILEEFAAGWGWMYETTHTDGKTARIDYTVWSEVFTCPACGGEIVFYDAAFDTSTNRPRANFRCPTCSRELNKKQLEPRRPVTRTLAGDQIERLEFRPIQLHYRVGGTKFSKSLDELDLAVLQRVARLTVPSFPSTELPPLHRVDAWGFREKGFSRVHHFWSDRALASLAVLWDSCESERDPTLRMALLFWAEQLVWGSSLMNRFVPTHFSHVNQFLSGVYYVGSLHAESSPWYTLVGTRPATGKRKQLARVWETSPARADTVAISTGSSSAVDLPDDSVDYVFVDPPFGENIYYSDLAYLTEAWHGVFTSTPEEAIVDHNKARPKLLPDYTQLIGACFVEFFRVLKPGRWMTVEFSNSSNEVWLSIQSALSFAGFVVADTRVIDKEQYSFRQVVAGNAVKRDLIISAYKPDVKVMVKAGIEEGSEDAMWAFVSEHLGKLPLYDGRIGEVGVVRERLADRIYDRTMAWFVSRNLIPPLTTLEFNDGVEQRFPVRDSMYYLPSQVESYERARMTVKELLQAELFITGEASALQWLRQQLKRKPRTFAELQPSFLTELQNGLPDWEDLPDLRELLEENFLQDDKARWYVPDPKKAADLDAVRARVLLKEFARYAITKGKLARFRTEALHAGFKTAYGERDYAMIVSVGRRLPEDLWTEEPGLLQYFKVAENQSR